MQNFSAVMSSVTAGIQHGGGRVSINKKSKSTSRLSLNKSASSIATVGSRSRTSSHAVIGGPGNKNNDIHNPFMITVRELKRI